MRYITIQEIRYDGSKDGDIFPDPTMIPIGTEVERIDLVSNHEYSIIVLDDETEVKVPTDIIAIKGDGAH